MLSYSLIKKLCCLLLQVLLETFAQKSRYFENSKNTVRRESSFLVKLQAKLQNLQLHLKLNFH